MPELFPPLRELVCECGWRHAWDWYPARQLHALGHVFARTYAIFHVEEDGKAVDR